MKLVYYVIFLLSLASLNSFAQTVSTASGGHWTSASTWVGGVPPSDNSDVIINGPVILPYCTVNNLTINSGGSIEDECCAGRTITVKGNLTNNGTIKSTHGGLWVYVQGSVYNNGSMIQQALVFSGSGDQIISSSKMISAKEIWKDPSGQIIANSNIVVDSVSRIYLDHDVLNMGSYKFTKLPGWVTVNSISGGVIYSNGDIDISGSACNCPYSVYHDQYKFL